MAREAKIKSLTKGLETRLHGELAQAQMFREIGTDWNEVRIGVCGSFVNDPGTADLYWGLPFFIGLSSGTTGVLTPNVAHAVGWGTFDSAAWHGFRYTRNLGTLGNTGCYFYYPSGSSCWGATFAGSNTTAKAVSSGFMGNFYLWGDINDSSFGSFLRVMYWLNIRKGTPWSFIEYGYPSSTAAADLLTRDEFLTEIEAAAPNPGTGHIRGTTARTIAVDEGTDGSLDHVHIACGFEKPAFYIDALSVVKIS